MEKIKSKYPEDEIIFCNGGDRKAANIPEMSVEGIAFKFGVGGDNKINSSSSILKNGSFMAKKGFGENFIIYLQIIFLKELIIEPDVISKASNEIWFVSKGSCLVKYSQNDPEELQEINLATEEVFHVKQGDGIS